MGSLWFVFFYNTAGKCLCWTFGSASSTAWKMAKSLMRTIAKCLVRYHLQWCLIDERVMFHIWMSHLKSLMRTIAKCLFRYHLQWCLIDERVMFHIWMSHVSYMNESCEVADAINREVFGPVSFSWMRHDSCMIERHDSLLHDSLMLVMRHFPTYNSYTHTQIRFVHTDTNTPQISPTPTRNPCCWWYDWLL